MSTNQKGTKRIALRGFSRLSLFPVLENTEENYEAGERFALPHAQSMTREADVSRETIYADDGIYLDLKTWNGLRSTITLVEVTLPMMAQLGFGIYDEATDTLSWNPNGTNREFAMTFACERTDGEYRMYRMYSFVVNDVAEGSSSTMGESGGVNTYQLSGIFTGRKLDKLPAQIHDGKNLDWLATIE